MEEQTINEVVIRVVATVSDNIPWDDEREMDRIREIIGMMIWPHQGLGYDIETRLREDGYKFPVKVEIDGY